MLKIFVGFVLFAALAMFVILKGGSSLDMSGEKHGDEAVHAPAEAASVAASDASAAK
jgi:archaellin